MAKIIVLFNHKGGVSKTTTTFNLGWMLANGGNRVIVADFDPQCNLTGMVMGFTNAGDITELYETDGIQNVKSGLAPAFESQPKPLEPVSCIPVEGNKSLFLLPGHIGLAEYETTLGIAQNLTSSIYALQNIPGSIINILKKTATANKADYILIDTSPSLSPLNCNLLMTCDYFLVPTSPDLYSVMAIDSLARTISRWYEWASQTSKLEIFKNATYPFPDPSPKFLGVIVQKYRPRGGSSPAKNFQGWISEVKNSVETKLVPVLSTHNIMLDSSKYLESDDTKYVLAEIPDFNSLIAASQATKKPVFTLTNTDTSLTGKAGQIATVNVSKFRNIFSDLTTKIVRMTSDG